MNPDQKKIMPLGYIVRKSAYEAYHGVVPLGLVGLLFTTLSMLLLLIAPGGRLWIWLLALLAVPVWTGAFAIALHATKGGRPSFRPFFYGFWRYLGRSLFLTLLNLLSACATYLVFRFWQETGSVIGATFAFFQLYAYLMFLLAQLYALPLLVKEDLPVVKAIAQSIRLFLRFPGYSIAIFLQLASLAVLLAVGTIALPLLFPGLAAVLLTNATLNLVDELPILNRSQYHEGMVINASSGLDSK